MLVETGEQRAARLQLWRAQDALRQAPEIAAYVRGLATSGRVEHGEVLSEFTSPLRLAPAAAADELYARILEWVAYFSEELQAPPPAFFPVAWVTQQKEQGFRAHTTAEGAGLLVRLQTMWLLVHGAQIKAHPAADAFQKDVIELVFTVRGKYPLSPRPERLVLPRACVVCGERAVRADWFSPDPLDVRVVCEVCGCELEVSDGVLPVLLDEEEAEES